MPICAAHAALAKRESAETPTTWAFAVLKRSCSRSYTGS